MLQPLVRLVSKALFTVLFGVHVLLRLFNQDIPWLWITRLMFWFGEHAGTGQGRILAVDELHVLPTHSVNGKRPFVIRAFHHEVSINTFLKEVGGETSVQTHSYDEKGDISDETISLADLVVRIQKGMSSNAKSVTFPPETCRSLLDGVEEAVDSIRGTTGMKWTDLARQFFIGGTDTFTRCHADPSLNCYLQISGIKRWRLSPPSSACELYVLPRGNNISYNSTVLKAKDSRFPAYERTDWYVVDLRPGDLLVIPPFWFHEVQNRESAMGCRNDKSSAEKDVVVGLAMNWLSPKHAWRQSFIMAAGSLLRPRPWRRYLRPDVCSVDEKLMKSCRQVCSCHDEFGRLGRDKKTAK